MGHTMISGFSSHPRHIVFCIFGMLPTKLGRVVLDIATRPTFTG